jgi:hypothetical protein
MRSLGENFGRSLEEAAVRVEVLVVVVVAVVVVVGY